MRQSTVIFGSLAFAFIIYITLRGQLPAYLGLFSATKTPTTSQSSGGQDTKDANTQPNSDHASPEFMTAFQDLLSQIGVK